MRLSKIVPLVLLALLARGAFAADEGVTWKCPGNDYKNTISAKEAEKLGCKKLEGAPVTVIQMTKPRPVGGTAPASVAGSGTAKVDPTAQRARDSDARRILEGELRAEEDRLAALKAEFNNGQPERQGNEQNYQKYVDRVAQLSASIARKEADIAAIKRELQKLPAAAPLPFVIPPGPAAAPALRADDAVAHAALDLLATMVAVVTPEGECIFANSSFESVLGLSRRNMSRGSAFDWFVEGPILQATVAAVSSNDFSTSRLDAQLRRPGPSHGELLPVRVIVNQIEGSRSVVLEVVEIEQQTRQAREERALEQAQATKELIRNLAHEIKNPLGGIRGAAQLLEMEIGPRGLTEYTQVIINEADRLQSLVDRLLAPHRKPHVVGNVNIHEVCERVRALIDAEFPNGLVTERDYDTSIPEFRGDREQLIQAVLNIAHNAAQALRERIERGDAKITLRTRVARQVTLGKHRYRLALELHIEDNGPGVPEALGERVFFPLVSGREGGSGLGLTLAQTFIQQHHGTVEFESEPGRTVFMITIPLA